MTTPTAQCGCTRGLPGLRSATSDTTCVVAKMLSDWCDIGQELAFVPVESEQGESRTACQDGFSGESCHRNATVRIYWMTTFVLKP